MTSVPAFDPARPPTTLVDAVRHHARVTPDKTAFVFLAGAGDEPSLTFGELDRRARAFAVALRRRGAAGKPVLVLFPPGLDFVAAFFGCLYAEAIAVPISAELVRKPDRLRAITDDAQVALGLSCKLLEPLVGAIGVRDWVIAEDVDLAAASAWTAPAIGPETLAFLQYTSGSTSTPKGVMVAHANLLANIEAQYRLIGGAPENTWVSWLPAFHDMGLIGCILQPAYGGYRAVLMSPLTFLKHPIRWLEAISRFRAIGTVAPNFAFELCVKRVTPEERAKLDLRSCRHVLNGAEPVRLDTLERFTETFAAAGFSAKALVPCYGLAEATLLVSADPAGREPRALHVDRAALERGRIVEAAPGPRSQAFVDCGLPMGGQTIAIVDPETRRRVAADGVGEIWVRGSSVARGYWRRPDETRETFEARIAPDGDGPYLRTGDLGFLRDGRLYVTGRLKDLIVIRGQNHYPQDLELTTERANPGAMPGATAAFSLDLGGEERLAVVAELDRRGDADAEAALRDIGRAIAEQHGLAAHVVVLIKRKTIARTTSGKIQRRACRAQLLALELDVVAASVLRDDAAPPAAPGRAGLLALDATSRVDAVRDLLLATIARRQGRDAAAIDPSVALDRAGVTFDVLCAVDDELYAEIGARLPLGRALARASLDTLAADVCAALPAAAVAARAPGASEIEAWIAARLAPRLGCAAAAVDLDRPFADHGLGSAEAVDLASQLEQWLGRPVPVTLAWDHPTVRAAARALGERAPRVVESARRARHDDPIAVVGLACRFPGAPDADAFWQLLRRGGDAITTTPRERWDADALYAPEAGTPGRLSTRWGGFVDDVDRFDARFFGISSREAERIDPQQRLLLELAWLALEDAGQAPDRLAGSATGVFVGISSVDYARRQLGDLAAIDAYAATGNALSIAANRISYVLDLRGPSLAIDTACSSSLVALHQACASLRAGDCALALAGGVNLLLTPELTIAFSHAKMMAGDGRCKTFDAAADGYVRGEGGGVVVLKRLSDARAAGDRVLAVIRGSAIGHDGRSSGLTAPNGVAQEAVIRAALADAGLAPRDVSYVEAHGTGTAIGDAIEVQALGRVFGAAERDTPLRIGSVKTNIGHLEAAAGVAGFIKVVLSLVHGEVPAHLHVREVNPQLALDPRVLAIATEAAPWTGADRRAGVSSFGFGGANAHVVVEAAPGTVAERAVDANAQLLALSAQSPEALRGLVQRVDAHLGSIADGELADVCHSLGVGRAALPCRLAVVVETPSAARAQLAAHLAGARVPGLAAGESRGATPRVAFLFTGQGSQLAGAGRQLHETQPVFRAALDRCAELLRPHLDVPLPEILWPAAGAPDRLAQTAYAQPALLALGWSLAALWRSWGVEPDAVLGHSLGEYAAACVGGALELGDALRLVALRGRLMQALPPGGMIAVLADRDRVESAMRRYNGALSVAAVNGPSNIVVSGELRAVQALRADLEAGDLDVHPLAVSHAFHSPMMEPILDEFERAARGLGASPLTTPLASNLTGELLRDAPLDAAYWRRHVREPVLFERGLRALREQGCTIFVEIGPRPTLISMGRRIVDDPSASWLPSLRPGAGELASMLATAGELFVRGVRIDHAGMDPDRRRRRVAVPTSAFERERYWIEAAPASVSPLAPPPSAARPADLDAVLALFREQTAAIHRLCGAAVPAPAIEAPVVAPAPVSPTRIADVVVAELSAVCGFPADRLRLDDRLVELGLDSLMIAELRERLGRRYPGTDLRAMPKATPETTVDDLVVHLRGLVPDAAVAAPPPPPSSPKEEPASATAPDAAPDPAWTDFTRWPEYLALRERLTGLAALGGNPYARVHDGHNTHVSVVDGREMINYASFNYLNLSADPVVKKAAREAVERYGTSTSATPLLLGETPLHLELEQELCELLGTEAAMVFASGHATNVTTVGHLITAGDLILHDELIHDSTVRGAMLSGARRLAFPHNDVAALDATLRRLRGRFRRVLIAVEGVYSQDGDLCRLPELIEVKRRHHALLMIDEAHSIGVLGARGAGVGEHFGVDRRDVDIWMGTLSKGLGSCGGYIAGAAPLLELLKFTAPGYIFGTSISPANAAAALAAIRVAKTSPRRLATLRANAKLFTELAHARGLDTGLSKDSAIVPIIIGEHARTMTLSNQLLADGINVMPIGYPAVPADRCRLRFFITAGHTEEQLRFTIDRLADAIAPRARPAAAPPRARTAALTGRVRVGLDRAIERLRRFTA